MPKPGRHKRLELHAGAGQELLEGGVQDLRAATINPSPQVSLAEVSNFYTLYLLNH